jgi:uncharacterized iron-regulated membrane protein
MLSSPTIRAWRAVHTWASLVCTVFLLILCLTGLPLIFHDEIDGWLSPGAPFATVAADAPVASLDRIVEAARAAHPAQFVRYVFLDDDAPQAFVVLAANRDGEPRAFHRLAYDTRTGASRGDDRKPDAAPDVTGFILRLHAFLLIGLPGELFLSLMGVLFVAAIVSGVVLYGPFTRKLDFGTVRRTGSRRLVWLDLHNVVGIVTLIWALVVGVTGVMNTLSAPLFGIWEMTDVARTLRPFEREAAVAPIASLQGAVDAALKAAPGSRLASITYPAHFQSSPQHYVVWLQGDRTLTSRLMIPVLVDARTGKVAQVLRMPWYLRALEVSRPLHFGDYGGLGLKILWAALDLLTIGMLASGVYLWATKRRSQVARASDVVGSDSLAAETSL